MCSEAPTYPRGQVTDLTTQSQQARTFRDRSAIFSNTSNVQQQSISVCASTIIKYLKASRKSQVASSANVAEKSIVCRRLSDILSVEFKNPIMKIVENICEV